MGSAAGDQFLPFPSKDSLSLSRFCLQQTRNWSGEKQIKWYRKGHKTRKLLKDKLLLARSLKLLPKGGALPRPCFIHLFFFPPCLCCFFFAFWQSSVWFPRKKGTHLKRFRSVSLKLMGPSFFSVVFHDGVAETCHLSDWLWYGLNQRSFVWFHLFWNGFVAWWWNVCLSKLMGVVSVSRLWWSGFSIVPWSMGVYQLGLIVCLIQSVVSCDLYCYEPIQVCLPHSESFSLLFPVTFVSYLKSPLLGWDTEMIFFFQDHLLHLWN